MIRCDEAMRNSKQRARKQQGLMKPRWRCNGDCKRCVCGMTQNEKGEWTHNTLTNQRPSDIMQLQTDL